MLFVSFEGQQRYAQATSVLKAQQNRENGVLLFVRKQVSSLEDNLSFSFLDGGGRHGWIIHLVFWSWFGVIASTLVAMSTAIQQKRYDGLIFAFVFMKLLLAPLIAMVVVAMIVYGITQDEIILSHNPLFLVFAFSAGFLSERLTEIVRQTANMVLASAAPDKAKWKSITNPPPRLPYIAREPVLSEPKTLKEVEENLRAVGFNKVLDFAEAKAGEADAKG